ncbi:MAG: cyclic nucleotide-binding domain-containing protein, partial [Planctomycetota bacterium]
MSTATLPPAASDLTPPDPTDPRIYPPLTDAQIERMRAFGEPREFAAGAVVFEQGQRESPFFFLDAGAVRIVERGPEGRQLVHVDAGTFIGDIAMFTGAPAAVACEAVGPVVAHVLDREKLRRLVTSHADIGDLVLRALLARRDWMRAQHVGEIKLLGPAWSDETHRLRTFLERNQVPFSWYDTEACTESCALTDALSITADDFPVIISGENVYRRPDIDGVANCLGLRPDLSEDEPYDLAVIGAGPGGLGAAVYGASEGLSTVVFEGDSPGGQAGTSSKIENYLGFVTGVSGQELTKQATLQARKFGAVMTNPTAVTGIVCDAADLPKRITLNDGRTIKAWA